MSIPAGILQPTTPPEDLAPAEEGQGGTRPPRPRSRSCRGCGRRRRPGRPAIRSKAGGCTCPKTSTSGSGCWPTSGARRSAKWRRRFSTGACRAMTSIGWDREMPGGGDLSPFRGVGRRAGSFGIPTRSPSRPERRASVAHSAHDPGGGTRGAVGVASIRGEGPPTAHPGGRLARHHSEARPRPVASPCAPPGSSLPIGLAAPPLRLIWPDGGRGGSAPRESTRSYDPRGSPRARRRCHRPSWPSRSRRTQNVAKANPTNS